VHQSVVKLSESFSTSRNVLSRLPVLGSGHGCSAELKLEMLHKQALLLPSVHHDRLWAGDCASRGSLQLGVMGKDWRQVRDLRCPAAP